MKKLILLALAIAFASCSSDDSAPVNPQNNNPAEPIPALNTSSMLLKPILKKLILLIRQRLEMAIG